MAATEAHIKEDQRKWSSASDYAAVLHLNRQYLRGEMLTTPYNHRPVDDDTRPHDNCLRLHDYGFLVYGWQTGGRMDPTFEPDSKTMNGDINASGEGPFYHQLEKRDCVHFLAPFELFAPGALHVFWFSLTQHPDIATRIVCVRRGPPVPAPTVMDHSQWNCGAVSSLQPLEVWVAAREWDGMLRVGVLVEDLALAVGLHMVYSVDEGSGGELGSAAAAA